MFSRFVAPERTLYPYVLRVLTILTFVLNTLIAIYYIQFSELPKRVGKHRKSAQGADSEQLPALFF